MTVLSTNALAFYASVIVSGLADALGFLHASRIWQEDATNGRELLLSGLGFAVGIAFYWLGLRFAVRVELENPETQTLSWFAITIIGVAVLSGSASTWDWPTCLIALLVTVSLLVLISRTAGA